jgi:hypothetical protein
MGQQWVGWGAAYNVRGFGKLLVNSLEVRRKKVEEKTTGPSKACASVPFLSNGNENE